tara:strand:+ start:248 stop:448 length:201 start_codon:yes stop_codon:yes gene_type:complete
MSKGSNFRPVDKKKYEDEYDRIFSKKKKKIKEEWSYDANGSPVDDLNKTLESIAKCSVTTTKNGDT